MQSTESSNSLVQRPKRSVSFTLEDLLHQIIVYELDNDLDNPAGPEQVAGHDKVKLVKNFLTLAPLP